MLRAPDRRLAAARPALAITLLAAACASAPAGPPASARDDARRLARALVRDSATSQALDRVDAFVREQRPVAAARALRDLAVPAAELTLRSLRGVSVRSDEGRALQERLVSVYERRIAAMRGYADALATTEEDFALLVALRAHREREQEAARVLGEVEALSALRGVAPASAGAPTGTAVNAPR